MIKFLVTLILFSIVITCKSQTAEPPDFSADRPGMATTAFVLNRGIFQIESGFSYEKIKTENTLQENTLYNSSLFRYGITKSAEVRLQADYTRAKTDSTNIMGFNPIILGTKLLISEGKGIIPKTAFMFNLTLPFWGKKDFKPQNLAPSAYLLMQNDITDKLNICYNIGLEYDGQNAAPADFLAVCLGYNFTDKLGASLESYGWFYNNTKPDYYADLALAFMLTKNFQFDISESVSLKDFKNYSMLNFGVAWMMR